MCQVSGYAIVAQSSECVWIMGYEMVLNMPVNILQAFKQASGSKYAKPQNMARRCEYARVTERTEYAWINLIIP